MIKAIIFDLDNTLIDFMKMKKASVESAVDAMIDLGLNIKKEEFLEKIYQVYWKEGIEDQQVFDKVLLQEFGYIDYKILAAGILGYRRAKEANLNVYPHTHFALTQILKKGVKMCIVSDAPKLPVWMRIICVNIYQYFDFVLTYDDTKERKPSPKPFLMALEKLQVKAQETLMVGDWIERDIIGAKNFGMKTVFAKYGDLFKTQEHCADYEINDILELVGIIDSENK